MQLLLVCASYFSMCEHCILVVMRNFNFACHQRFNILIRCKAIKSLLRFCTAKQRSHTFSKEIKDIKRSCSTSLTNVLGRHNKYSRECFIVNMLPASLEETRNLFVLIRIMLPFIYLSFKQTTLLFIPGTPQISHTIALPCALWHFCIQPFLKISLRLKMPNRVERMSTVITCQPQTRTTITMHRRKSTFLFVFYSRQNDCTAHK